VNRVHDNTFRTFSMRNLDQPTRRPQPTRALSFACSTRPGLARLYGLITATSTRRHRTSL
jgi:hypothetical protein